MSKENVKNQLDDAVNIIDNWLTYQYTSSQIPGFVAAIVHENKIIFNKAYGYARLSTRGKLKKDNIFRIASISKIFTAVSIMQLVERGKVNLDDRVVKYLPWFKSSRDKNFEKITVRQLLNHTGGIIRDGYMADFWALEANFLDKKQLIGQIHNKRNIYPSNEQFKYSNIGPSILGQLIEGVTGLNYKEYIEKNILLRLGLQNTFTDFESSIDQNMARGHGKYIRGQERLEFKNIKTNAMSSAVGFCSNTEDLCKFLSALFTESNKLLTEESKKEMQRVQWVTEDNKVKWGLGYEIWKVDKKYLIGHSGGFPGFITQIAMDMKNKIGIVVLTNAYDANATDTSNSIYHIIHHVITKYNNYNQNKVSNIKKYVGRFYKTGWAIDVRQINQELILFFSDNEKPFEKVFRLKQLSKTKFQIISGDEFAYIGETLQYFFDKDETIKKVYFGGMPYSPSEY